MRDVSLTGAQVPSMPGGMSGFQRLNMSDGSAARSSCQPPSRIRPNTAMRTEPTMRMIVCTASVYATPRIPPATVYSPGSTTTATEQTQRVQLVVGEGHAARRARAGETDEVLGADVGGEDGRPDDEPAQVAAGEKVIVGGVPVHPNRPPGESEQQAEVQQNDQPVPARHACSLAAVGRGEYTSCPPCQERLAAAPLPRDTRLPAASCHSEKRAW